jgi:nucleotide-binding universal stress UspA family protein
VTDAAPRPLGPVVVGVDGSEPARAALRWAADAARRLDVPLRVVLAWEVTLDDELVPRDGPVAVERERAARAVVERALAADADALDGLATDVRVVRGPAVTALLDAADDGVMLVVGARGRGGFEKLLLGSVSQQVVQHATGTVVVVR